VQDFYHSDAIEVNKLCNERYRCLKRSFYKPIWHWVSCKHLTWYLENHYSYNTYLFNKCLHIINSFCIFIRVTIKFVYKVRKQEKYALCAISSVFSKFNPCGKSFTYAPLTYIMKSLKILYTVFILIDNT